MRLSHEYLDCIKRDLQSFMGRGNRLDAEDMRQPCNATPTRQSLYLACDAIGALQFDLIEAINALRIYDDCFGAIRPLIGEEAGNQAEEVCRSAMRARAILRKLESNA